MRRDLGAIDTEYGVARGTFTTYVIGFISSVVLTLIAFYLVYVEAASVSVLAGTVVALALVQFVLQVIFFLHLSPRSKARWNFLALSFTTVVILILVLGTLWIMTNLNYHGHSVLMMDEAGNQVILDY